MTPVKMGCEKNRTKSNHSKLQSRKMFHKHLRNDYQNQSDHWRALSFSKYRDIIYKCAHKCLIVKISALVHLRLGSDVSFGGLWLLEIKVRIALTSFHPSTQLSQRRVFCCGSINMERFPIWAALLARDLYPAEFCMPLKSLYLGHY